MKITKSAKFIEYKNAFEVEINVYLEQRKSSKDMLDLYRASCSLISNTFLNDSGISYQYNHLAEALHARWGNVSRIFPSFRVATLVVEAKTPGAAKSMVRGIQSEVIRSLKYIKETNRSGALDAEDINSSPAFEDAEYNLIPQYGHYGNGDNLETSLDRE